MEMHDNLSEDGSFSREIRAFSNAPNTVNWRWRTDLESGGLIWIKMHEDWVKMVVEGVVHPWAKSTTLVVWPTKVWMFLMGKKQLHWRRWNDNTCASMDKWWLVGYWKGLYHLVYWGLLQSITRSTSESMSLTGWDRVCPWLIWLAGNSMKAAIFFSEDSNLPTHSGTGISISMEDLLSLLFMSRNERFKSIFMFRWF